MRDLTKIPDLQQFFRRQENAARMGWFARLLTRIFPTKTLWTPESELYLRRWVIFGRLDKHCDNSSSFIKKPWSPFGRGLYLHQMLGPDAGRHVHDHPWNFRSLVLRGGYVETVVSEINEFHNVRCQGDYDYRPPEWLHRITYVLPNTWTLVLCGRREREWGFLVKDRGLEHWVREDVYRKMYLHGQ